MLPEKTDLAADFMLVLAVAMALQFMTAFIPPTWPFRIYLTHLGLLVLTFILIYSGRLSWKIYRLPEMKNIPSILALSAVTVLAAQAAAYATFYIGSPPAEYLELLRALVPISPTSLMLSTIMTWLLVAPAEESIFRGVIFGMMKRMAGYRHALVFSAIIFSLAHLDVWRLPSTLIVGLTTATAYHRTGTITSSIIIHALNNTVSLTLSYIMF